MIEITPSGFIKVDGGYISTNPLQPNKWHHIKWNTPITKSIEEKNPIEQWIEEWLDELGTV